MPARSAARPAGPAPPGGLTTAEAAARLAAEGENRLAEARAPSAWKLLARQFNSLMMWVLLGAVVVSLVLRDWVEAAGIGAIILLNACAAALQEWKAESALLALRALAAPRTTVVRDGRPVVLPTREVVRGDLLLLEAGDVVGADARLIEAASLETNEALLTGESLPVSKRAAALRTDIPASAPGAPEERTGVVFAGTSVTRGQGRAVVTATGMATEFGRIAGLLQQAEGGVTPLQRRLDRVSRHLLVLCAAIVALIFALGLARGDRPFDLLLAALSLAVAAVPEGLPTVVTLALAAGVQRMARRRALVRHLAAVETLGTAQVICSDKTGTLTTGELRVRALWMPGDGGPEVRRRLRHAAAACNDADLRPGDEGPVIVGDPTEGALLLDAAADGWSRADIEIAEPRLLVIPFESERKRMAIVRSSGQGAVVFVKGAPEVVLPRCARFLRETGTSPLDAETQARVLDTTHRMAADALRVLAFAVRPLPPSAAVHALDADGLEQDLTFLGLAALADTPRPEARESVARCGAAGVRVVMITGDHPVTAAAIARELGILPGGDAGAAAVLDGRGLDALDDDGLALAAERTAVYARVTPTHKLRLVRALKRRGLVVAMTGDGVNDAPAIREASVGIAMGRTGTEVTRQAADIIVTDDNFATIVNALEEGRRIFDNIQRALLYLLAGNLGEVLVMLVAALAGWPVPLLPVHLLWVNFVTDGFPALALATEPVHPDALRRPPRRADAEFADPPFLRRLALAGSLIALVSLAGFRIGFREGDAGAARALGFAVLVTSHITWAFAARSRSRTSFGLGVFSNLRLLLVLAATLLVQVLLQSHAATAAFFGLPPLSAGGWLRAVALGLVPVTIIELSKLMPRGDGAGRRSAE
jgi:Ca2+-transporting ATPase